jgi:RimJ/RimL family protein N-acetyltransferase
VPDLRPGVVAETDRLTLREWTIADERPFYEVMNTPAVMRWLGGLQTAQEWHAAFERLLGYQQALGHTFWLVERREDHALLGMCGLKRVNAPGASCPGAMEIGWRFRENAWGKGYAAEAAAASLDLAFDRFAAMEVVALTVIDNVGSWRLMERLGMRRRTDLDYDDTRFPSPSDFNPHIVYSIDAEDWVGR